MYIDDILKVAQLPLGNLPAGPIGTAAATVDTFSSFKITQTTAGITLTIPSPTDTTAGDRLVIENDGTVAFTVLGVSIAPNQFSNFYWTGSAWTPQIAVSPPAWLTPGNLGTTNTPYNDGSAQASNFAGTLDNQPFSIYTDASHANAKTDLKLYTAIPSTSAITAPVDVFHIRRNGQASVTYPQVMTVALGHWFADINSRTRADFKLGNGGVYTPDFTPMALFSQGGLVVGGNGVNISSFGWSPAGGIGKNNVAGALFSLTGGNATTNVGPHTSVTTSLDDFPLRFNLHWQHDNMWSNFDGYYDGAWKASHTSRPMSIYKNNSELIFMGQAALPVAAGSAWTQDQIASFRYGGAAANFAGGELFFKNIVKNRRIVLYEGAVGDDHQFYGFGINNATLRYQVAGTSANHRWFASTGAAASNEIMSLLGTGALGINNVPAPTATLDVGGNARIRTIPAGAAADTILTADASGNVRALAASSLIPDFWRSGAGTILPDGTTDTTEFISRLGVVAIGASASVGASQLGVVSDTNTITDPIASFLANNQTQGIDLLWGGIVKNATTANSILSINAKGTGDIILHGGPNGEPASTGRVGINIAAPTARLHVNGPNANGGAAPLFRLTDTNIAGSYFAVDNGGVANAYRIIVTTNLELQSSANSNQVVLAPSGFVGLGTNAPTVTLDVVGRARIRTLPAGAGTDVIVTADASGNLRASAVTAAGLVNIYNSDGTLTGNRIVNMAAKTLTFQNATAALTGHTFKNSVSTLGGIIQVDATNDMEVGMLDANFLKFQTTGLTRGQFTPGGKLQVLGSGTANAIGLQLNQYTLATPVTVGAASLGIDNAGNVVIDKSATNVSTVAVSTVLTANDGTVHVNNVAAAVTITLPSAVLNAAKTITIRRLDATSVGAITIASVAGTVQAPLGTLAATTTIPLTAGNRSMTWQSNGTNWYLIGQG